MLLGPVDVDLAGAHGRERALHAERADVDVGDDHDDQRQRDDAVPGGGVLHLLQRRQLGRQVGSPTHVRRARRSWRTCAVWNGNIRAMPESDSDSPPSITDQNRIFWPALNFQAGGCEPLTNMPPPLASQTTSRQCGKLWRIQTTKVSASADHEGERHVVVQPLAGQHRDERRTRRRRSAAAGSSGRRAR